MYEKLILLTSSQIERLEKIQKSVKKTGSAVSVNQLIRDSVQIFLENYGDVAVKKYSSTFYDSKEEI